MFHTVTNLLSILSLGADLSAADADLCDCSNLSYAFLFTSCLKD